MSVFPCFWCHNMLNPHLLLWLLSLEFSLISQLVLTPMLSSLWVPLAPSDSITVLTCPSVYALQAVSDLAHSDSFYNLTCPSICTLQEVSSPFSLIFFLHPNLSYPLPLQQVSALASLHSFKVLCPESPLSLPFSWWVALACILLCFKLSLSLHTLGSVCPFLA